MSRKIKIAIAGSAGRMGKALLEAVFSLPDIKLVAALEQPNSPHLGKNAGQFLGIDSTIVITENIQSALAAADCLIDFTQPEGTLAHLKECLKTKTKIVIGTTGFSETQKQEIAHASRSIPIVMAPNMSVGVNLVFKLLAIAAQILDEGYDIEIIEAHHRHKVDAPSGTALRMGEIIAETLDRKLSDCAIYGREGRTGERNPKTIGFATVRAGDIVGDHTVLFAGIGERVEITHRSSSRATYAMGALRAALFLKNKKSGLFDMQDVLGL